MNTQLPESGFAQYLIDCFSSKVLCDYSKITQLERQYILGIIHPIRVLAAREGNTPLVEELNQQVKLLLKEYKNA